MMRFAPITVLDHGYVRLIESWGKGDAGVSEAGIIEAARQSTQGSFRQWAPYEACEHCTVWRVNEQDVLGLGSQLCEGLGYASEHKWKKFPRGDEGLLSFLFNNKPQHSTPFEFAGLVIEVQAPIFVFREWHRHRTQAYNEMSARYAPLPDLNYMPNLENLHVRSQEARITKNRQASGLDDGVILTGPQAQEWLSDLQAVYDHVEKVYQRGLKIGVPKELARCSMTVARFSRMRASTSLRNWLAFLTLRADKGAQWEIRQFANAVGQIVANEMPRTWKLFDLARVA